MTSPKEPFPIILMISKSWNDYDWWSGAASLLLCKYEREFEQKNGPVHSYSFPLNPAFKSSFQYAWVNRIIMFLRRWWAVNNCKVEEKVFGPIPSGVIYLTHDVDAVEKTLSIRAKQAAFQAFNREFRKIWKTLFRNADYWQFDKIVSLEKSFGYKSVWNFYSGGSSFFRGPQSLVFDPS